MIQNTRKTADHLVSALAAKLADMTPQDLPSIRSVYVMGSWVRGDWLNCLSDLDLHLLLWPDSTEAQREQDLAELKAVAKGICPGGFAAHYPGGIDWGWDTHVPTTESQVRTPCGNPFYGVFFFDFCANNHLIWGDDFTSDLPPPIDPRELLLPTLDFVEQMVSRGPGVPGGSKPLDYRAYRAAVMAQLAFGELTLDKTRMLNLYLKVVPDFGEKPVGELVIRRYLGSVYPHAPLRCLDSAMLSAFISGVSSLIREHVGNET